MKLSIQRAWNIECHRCANDDSHESNSPEEARAAFARWGWTRGDEGFQMCPQCNGTVKR